MPEELPEKAEQEKGVLFEGRLGKYRYYDMHHIVAEALECSKKMK